MNKINCFVPFSGAAQAEKDSKRPARNRLSE